MNTLIIPLPKKKKIEKKARKKKSKLLDLHFFLLQSGL